MNALRVAHENAAFAIYSNRVSGAELAGLIARASKAIQKLSFMTEFEDSFGECTQRVNVSQSVNGDAGV